VVHISYWKKIVYRRKIMINGKKMIFLVLVIVLLALGLAGCLSVEQPQPQEVAVYHGYYPFCPLFSIAANPDNWPCR
jgi:hypothetical protein